MSSHLSAVLECIKNKTSGQHYGKLNCGKNEEFEKERFKELFRQKFSFQAPKYINRQYPNGWLDDDAMNLSKITEKVIQS